MSYPTPLQVHVIWHPRSDAECRPLAERIYTLLNRDAFQPLVPGIGIPVFFRAAGADPSEPLAAPAPIAAPEEGCDLRVVLLTADLVLDDDWERFRATGAREVAKHRDRAATVSIALGSGIAAGDEKAIVLDPKSARTPELVVQHTLLQACRLLARRPRDGELAERGAAPLRLFLSHTKRDKTGLTIARALKDYLDETAVDRFFDEVSIQPGDGITAELKASIKDSALVAIRTDGYVASPWCRLELALAKRERRPMAVIDALSEVEPRSTPFLANLASVRIDPQQVTTQQLDRAANFIGLEVLRFLHVERQLALLTSQGIVPAGAVLLPRPPEPRDIVAAQKGAAGGNVFVHPDPVLSAEEIEEFAPFGATFKTPISAWSRELDGLKLGLSVSGGDKAEESALGLSALHLEDAIRVVARQALAAGATLVYGGALNANTLQTRNLTEALYEMIFAYNRSGHAAFFPLVNYTPWPWHEEVDAPWLAQRRESLKVIRCDAPAGIAARFGDQAGPGHVERLAATPRGRYALARSLSAMRERIAAETEARVLLGGRPTKFMGVLPGILEEAMLSIRRNQPLYVAGGFGGAARLVGLALQGQKPTALTREYQIGASPPYGEMLQVYDEERIQAGLPTIDYDMILAELGAYGMTGLAATNGLTVEENLELFRVASVDAVVYLVMKGLAHARPI